jgi:hypothetical protein
MTDGPYFAPMSFSWLTAVVWIVWRNEYWERAEDELLFRSVNRGEAGGAR